MKQAKLPAWLQALFGSLGPGGSLFVVSFLDSSVLSFPFLNDLLLMQFSISKPARLPYYVLMSTLGSLAGCFWLYYLAKKGGEVMYHKRAGKRAERIRGWVLRYKFWSVAIPSVLPPPLPFKAFVLAAGVFQVPPRTFAAALLAGRAARYLFEGFLAIRYGAAAEAFFAENKITVILAIIGTFALTYGVVRWAFGSSRKSH